MCGGIHICKINFWYLVSMKIIFFSNFFLHKNDVQKWYRIFFFYYFKHECETFIKSLYFLHNFKFMIYLLWTYSLIYIYFVHIQGFKLNRLRTIFACGICSFLIEYNFIEYEWHNSAYSNIVSTGTVFTKSMEHFQQNLHENSLIYW